MSLLHSCGFFSSGGRRHRHVPRPFSPASNWGPRCHAGPGRGVASVGVDFDNIQPKRSVGPKPGAAVSHRQRGRKQQQQHQTDLVLQEEKSWICSITAHTGSRGEAALIAAALERSCSHCIDDSCCCCCCCYYGLDF